MKITFRIECPHCHWGHPFRDGYVNMGWLEVECTHCGERFFTKVTVTGVNVETEKALPEGVPVMKML